MFLHSIFGSEKSKNLYFEKLGKGKTALIFLHGLAGSRRQWDKIYRNLAKKYTLYFVDLLGFGYSAKPHGVYNLETHLEALRKFIQDEVSEKKVILVGHSLGAIIALGYLAKYTKSTEKVILFSLPFYKSAEEAMDTIQAYSKPKYFVIDSLFTRIACTLWCYYGGSLSRHIMPYFYRSIPKEIATDGLLHTYNSYISTLYNVIYHQNLPRLLTSDIKKKILLVHGEKDEVAPLKNIQELAKKYSFDLNIFTNEGHGLPLDAKHKVYTILKNL